jgi:chromosome segregation ATPase
MGVMSTEPFKLDSVALLVDGIRSDVRIRGDNYMADFACDATERELSRQLHTAGAPDAPLEQQLGALLADHIAMRAAGAEMPSEAMVADRVYEQCGNNEAAINAASRVLDLFRPLFARLTFRRDAARSGQEVLKQSNRSLAKENAVLTQERDAARDGHRRNHEEAWAAHQALADMREQRDALRQRAERAEREVEAARKRDVRREVEIATALRLRDDANVAATNLRARIVDLERENEKWATSTARMLADERAKLVAAQDRIAELESRRAEPNADMVERLADIAWDAVDKAAQADPDNEQGEMFGIMRDGVPVAVRAVLSALAAMGEEAWPTEQEIIKAALSGERFVDTWPNVLVLFRSRLAPVIGALRAKVVELEAEAAHDQDPNEPAPQAFRRVREERDELRAQVQEHVEEARRDGRRIGELGERASRAMLILGDSAAKSADRISDAMAILAPTAPEDTPVRAVVPEGQADGADVTNGQARAVVDLSSWPALREVEARSGGVVFLGDDMEGVAVAFAKECGPGPGTRITPVCLCPASSEYDPPCPRHGVKGIGVTGR